MPRKLAKAPQFESEAEEADWYATPEGRGRTAREFGRAFRSGKLTASSGKAIPTTDVRLLEKLIEQAKEKTTRAISIRVPVSDLERARQIADRKGVGYQTVLKQAIRDGLKRAE